MIAFQNSLSNARALAALSLYQGSLSLFLSLDVSCFSFYFR